MCHSDYTMAQKTKKMGQKVTDWPKTTVRIPHLELVQLHALKQGLTFNAYVNELIAQDIIRNADHETILKVVKGIE